jgi:ubiquinone/menaquinone biosynthesis C-methylase UbiE
MFTKLFMSLIDIPVFRTIFWKPAYNFLADRFPNPEWQFMNYGYCPAAGEGHLHLEPKDEHHRYSAQMYHFLAKLTGIDGKCVLEIGCGRGGGANFLYKYHKPESYKGLDIADKAIKFCQSSYSGENLSFIAGNAEKLPFPDHSFDVIINVESSHTYSSVDKFLSEVKRVLKKDGILLLVDMRSPENRHKFVNQFENAGLSIVSEEDITDNVNRALEKGDLLNSERIRTSFPKYIQKYFREFAAAKGSYMYNAFRDKEILYWRYVISR